MDQHASWRVIDGQRTALADLLEDLSPQEWATLSWCSAWTVKDVAAHLSMAPNSGVSDLVSLAIKYRGNFDTVIREASLARSAARDTDEVIADLRDIVGSRRLAPTTFWRDPLVDILVHGQDLTRPLGRVWPMPIDAAKEAAEWSWRRRFPFWPARRLRGVELVADDVDWRRGQGAEVRGPIGSLLLLSTGRYGALADVEGPGVSVLTANYAAA